MRAALLDHSALALRMMVAHAIHGSPLWQVRVEPQIAKNDDVRESIETCRAETLFDAKRRAVLALLGFDGDTPSVCGGYGDDSALTALFAKLVELDDQQVLEVLTVVMGETLCAGSAAVEALGNRIGIEMADFYEADDALFDNLRDKEVLSAIVCEVAGESVAAANACEKAKTLKQIIRDHLDGAEGRARVEHWVPRWMAFPPTAYTSRGGVGSVSAAARANISSRPAPLAEAA